jgi:uncharacterized DUF497 family protein
LSVTQSVFVFGKAKGRGETIRLIPVRRSRVREVEAYESQ